MAGGGVWNSQNILLSMYYLIEEEDDGAVVPNTHDLT